MMSKLNYGYGCNGLLWFYEAKIYKSYPMMSRPLTYNILKTKQLTAILESENTEDKIK